MLTCYRHSYRLQTTINNNKGWCTVATHSAQDFQTFIPDILANLSCIQTSRFCPLDPISVDSMSIDERFKCKEQLPQYMTQEDIPILASTIFHRKG